MSDYTIIVGLEVHVQLQTASKLFCGCPNRFNPEHPNTQTCPVCLGLPGSLPVMNRQALELAIRTGLALNCEILPLTRWDRKQYHYPDLPKAYQISQYDMPFSQSGWLEFDLDGTTKRVGIIRAHLEEDAGKNLHDESGGRRESRVDLNRCGTPLVEIVSEPDIRSPQEAKRYLEELRLLLTYLDVSDCNMQEGSLRCDANVNLHLHAADGHVIPTPIVEVKNLNSFRGVEAAIEYEARRQHREWGNRVSGALESQALDAVIAEMKSVAKETRGWNQDKGVTFAQRGKEEASDYRYFPDPDLMPVEVSEEWRESIRATMGELPADRRTRIREAFQISDYDAAVIIDQGHHFADYYETVAHECQDGKAAANWVTQDVLREMHERACTVQEFPLSAPVLGNLIGRITRREITTASGRELFEVLLTESADGQTASAGRIDALIDERGLAIVSDTGELDGVISSVLEANPAIVEDVRGGKQAAVGPLIGQVMREVKGADPKTVREMLLKRIQNPS